MDQIPVVQPAAYDEIIDRFVAWATREPTVEAAVVIGSRARTDHPADAWSDLDIVVFSTEPQRLIAEDVWLRYIGSPVITCIESTAVGTWHERRVLFDGARDVDFAVLPADVITALAGPSPDASLLSGFAGVVVRGYRVLFDKEQRLSPILARIAASIPRGTTAHTWEQVTETLSDFWYHCVWIAKKLRRGEMIVAHECLDSHQRRLLMRLVRWQAERNGAVWHGTRFMEEWAHPHVVALMPGT